VIEGGNAISAFDPITPGACWTLHSLTFASGLASSGAQSMKSCDIISQSPDDCSLRRSRPAAGVLRTAESDPQETLGPRQKRWLASSLGVIQLPDSHGGDVVVFRLALRGA